MSGTKKLPKYVTAARMARMLSDFARAADATFAVRLTAMEDRLRAEFAAQGASPPDAVVRSLAVANMEGGALMAAEYEHLNGGAVFHTEDQQFTVDETGRWHMVDATHEGNHLAPAPDGDTISVGGVTFHHECDERFVFHENGEWTRVDVEGNPLAPTDHEGGES